MKTSMQRLIVSGAIAAGVMSLGAGAIMAAENAEVRNPMSGLVSAIATRFNLNQADVQKVFDEERTAHQAEMQATRDEREKARLAELVAAGKLTREQADKIAAKAVEIHAFMDTLIGKTPAERQEAMKAQAEAMKQWATDNGIPEQYMLPFGGGMRGPGFMGGEMRGQGGRGHGGGQGFRGMGGAEVAE